MVLRISASIILLFSILFMPFWISVILALVGIAYFPFFLEAIFLSLLSDFLYGAKEAGFFNINLVFFAITLICFIVLELLKSKLRFHTEFNGK